MAVKATKVDAPLTVMDLSEQTGFNPMAGMVEPERGSYLPQLKLPYAVEKDLVLPVIGDDGKPMVRSGQPVTESAVGRLVLCSGKGKIEQIKAPYLLTAYCIRGATRTLNADNKYDRTYASFNNGKNTDKHEAAMAAADDPKSGTQRGNVALIVVLPNDGKGGACVAIMDLFRTQTKYWGEVLKNGMLFNGKQAVRITIDDHRVNFTTSAKGMDYYSYSKFNQWSQVTLTDEQMGFVKDALKANQKACDEWLNKTE